MLVCLAPISSADDPDPPATTVRQIESDTGESVTVQYSIHSNRSARFEIFVPDGDGGWATHEPEPVRTYLGTVDGHPGAVAAGLMRKDGTFWSRISFEDGEEWISKGGTADIRTSAFTPEWPTTEVGSGGAGSEVFAAELGLDLANRQVQGAGGTVDEAVEVAEFSVMATNAIYLRDAAILHRIGKVVVRTDPAEDPYDDASDTGDLLSEVRSRWNAGIPMGGGHDLAMVASDGVNGGLAAVGVIGTNGGYSANDSDSDGDFTVVWRHEAGHNWGSGHYEGGGNPEGPTIMSNNSLARFSSSELLKIINHRDDRAWSLDPLGAYPVSLPPRANMDRYRTTFGVPNRLDPLVNDSDSNGQAIRLLEADAVTRLGGSVTISAGTGPEGRDELIYNAPSPFTGETDSFAYRIEDEDGRTATGYVAVRSSLVDPAVEDVMLAHWALDEGGGETATDLTIVQNNGVLKGGVGWLDEGRVGSSALDFSGDDSEVEAVPLEVETDRLTITGWIRRDGPQPDWAGLVFTRSGSPGYGLNFRDDGSTLGFHWGAGSNPSWRFDSGLTVPDDIWTFCALTVTPDEAKLYMRPDGGAMESVSASGDFGVAEFGGALKLGHDANSGSRRFAGAMDDVRIYQRALTTEEIGALAGGNGTPVKPEPAIAEFLPLSEEVELSWEGAPAATAYEVYLGTDFEAVRDADAASPEFVGTFTEETVTVPVSTGGSIFWRVDSQGSGATLAGQVWFFRMPRTFASVADGAWDEASIWSNGRAAPTTGTQGQGDVFVIRGHDVASEDPGANQQGIFGSGLTVGEGGRLDLAREHGTTLQNTDYSLPPIHLEAGGGLRFRASLGSVKHRLASDATISGASRWEISGGAYAHDVDWSGAIDGDGRIDFVSSSNAGAISGDRRTLAVKSGPNPFSGTWMIEHAAGGDDFARLSADAPGALGTGKVIVGRRAEVEPGVPGGLDSVSVVELDGADARLNLPFRWENPEAELMLAGGTPRVSISTAGASIGTLSGTSGAIAAPDGPATLEIDQDVDASFAGEWPDPLTLVKRGAAELALEGAGLSRLGAELEEGALRLGVAAPELASLEMTGGDLVLDRPDVGAAGLAVAGDVTHAAGTITLRLGETPAAGTGGTLLRYHGALEGSPEVVILGPDGGELAAALDYGTRSDSEIAFTLGGSYRAWLEAHGVPPDRSGLTDRNGPLRLPNLISYALGLDPAGANPGDLARVSGWVAEPVPGLRVSFRRGTSAPDTSVRLETSTDLSSWSAADILDESTSSLDADAERVTAVVSIPAGAGRVFFRLRVEKTE